MPGGRSGVGEEVAPGRRRRRRLARAGPGPGLSDGVRAARLDGRAVAPVAQVDGGDRDQTDDGGDGGRELGDRRRTQGRPGAEPGPSDGAEPGAPGGGRTAGRPARCAAGGTARRPGHERPALARQGERGHDGAGEQAVDVAQLVRQPAAVRAVGEVSVDRSAVTPGEAASDMGAEAGAVGRARLGARRQDVRLQVALAQALPGAVGQHGHGVGRHADRAGHLPGSLSLDGGVPQHGLPAIGQVGERLGDERAFGEVEGSAGLGSHHGLGHLVEGVVVGAAPAGGQPADGHEQVRPERVGGPAPAPGTPITRSNASLTTSSASAAAP